VTVALHTIIAASARICIATLTRMVAHYTVGPVFYVTITKRSVSDSFFRRFLVDVEFAARQSS